MSNLRRAALYVVTACMAMFVVCSDWLPANASPTPTSHPSTPFSTTRAPTTTCADYAGLTNHIAGCVRVTLDNATANFFNPQTGLYHIVSDAITAMMIIAVAVFGCMAAFGMLEKVGRDSIVLLLKIAAVSYFSTNCDGMYATVIAMMDNAAQTVVSSVPLTGTADNTSKDFSQLPCLKKLTPDPSVKDASPGVVGPWLAMDCLLDTVIGIRIDPDPTTTAQSALNLAQKAYNENLSSTDQGLSRGLIYLFFSSYHTSVMGVLLAIIGFIFIWGLINIIVKALFIYIAGYIGIAVMMMMAPIFIPMVLFQVTRGYFDKWLKLIISFAMQPIIILAFIVFSISAVDLAAFSGDYSIMYRIAGDASRAQGFSLNTYLITPHPTRDDPTVSLPVIRQTPIELAQIKTDLKSVPTILDTQLGVSQTKNSNCTADAIKADTAAAVQAGTATIKDGKPEGPLQKFCDQHYPIQLLEDTLNMDQLAYIRTPAVVVPPLPANATKKEIDDASTAAAIKAAPAKEITQEIFSAVIFAAIVVFVMNQLLMVIPAVAYDLLGDFSQSPNLGGIVGGTPGKGDIKGKLNKMLGGK